MTHVNELSRTVLLMSLSLALSSCGSGGGGGASSNPGVPQPPIATISSTTVSVDNSVPTTVTNSITEILSPISSGPLTSPIQIATTQSRDSLLLALDATGKIRLASVTSIGTTILSADSTAVALVRMAIGALPSDITASQANQAIRTAAEFPSLVAVIQGALNSDLPPLDSGAVVQSVATTVRQAMSAVSAVLAPAPAAPAAIAYASPSVNKLPFNIISNVASLFSVYVNSAGSGGSVNVVNAMPIAWSAHSLDETGTLIPAPAPSPDGKVLLDANTVVSSLLDKLHPWLGPSSINLPGNRGKGLDIKLEQTKASHRRNLSEILKGAVAATLPILGNECLEGVAEALISADSLDAFAQEATIDAFKDALIGDVIASEPDLGGVISKCAPNLAPKAKELGRFARLLAKTLTALSAVQAFDDAATLAAKVVLTATHWNTPPTAVAVCMAKSSFFGTPEIQNCAAQFTFDKNAPILVSNARFTQKVTALTSGGTPTGLPIGVTHTSDDALQAVVTVNTQTGEVIANGVGAKTIIVEDPFTKTREQYSVTVVKPIIRPGIVKLALGQAMSLSLTDAAGNPVIADQSGMVWTSSDETIAIIDPLTSALTYPNSVNVIARKAGKVTIKVTNPVLFDVVTAEVEVLGTVVNVCEADVPTYAPSGCEWPRIVARNPYTPLQAGQAVPFSELFEYRPGTCSEITKMNMGIGYDSIRSTWEVGGIPDYYVTNFRDFGGSFLPTITPPAYPMGSITLKPIVSTDPIIFINSIWTTYYGDDPYVPALKAGYINCTFRQGSSGSGP